jgi:hypothetical protein
MVTEHQHEQAERIETLRNDADLRRQQQKLEPPNTFHQHAQSAANDISGGRFGALGAPHVVGSAPIPKYPQAGTPFQIDPVGDEPPLSAYENPALDPSTVSPSAAEDSGDPTNARPAPALSSGEQREVGSPLSDDK